jgi:hypothetical protein
MAGNFVEEYYRNSEGYYQVKRTPKRKYTQRSP